VQRLECWVSLWGWEPQIRVPRSIGFRMWTAKMSALRSSRSPSSAISLTSLPIDARSTEKRFGGIRNNTPAR
jgi:hypothetical protein